MVKIILASVVSIAIAGCVSAPGRLAKNDYGGSTPRPGYDLDSAAQTDHSLAANTRANRVDFAAGAAPKYNVERDCKAASVLGDSGGYDSCVQQELTAKEKLTQEWDSLPSAARRQCAPAPSESLSGSYVEATTCLEMRDLA